MNFCMPYYKQSRYNEQINEFYINSFTKEKGDALMLFAMENKDKKIVINANDFYENDLDVELMESIYKVNNNVIYIIHHMNKELRASLEELGIPYFFSVKVDSWDLVHSLAQTKTKEMYICNDLGFELIKVRRFLKDKDIKIRVFANVSQGKDPERVLPSHKGFFIRPEDIKLYKNTIDTIEFFNVDSLVKSDTMYKIYALNQYWFGDLREIIFGLETPMNSKHMVSTFGLHRMNCGKKCFKGFNCRFCDQVCETAEVLEQNDIVIKKDKEKKDEQKVNEAIAYLQSSTTSE